MSVPTATVTILFFVSFVSERKLAPSEVFRASPRRKPGSINSGLWNMDPDFRRGDTGEGAASKLPYNLFADPGTRRGTFRSDPRADHERDHGRAAAGVSWQRSAGSLRGRRGRHQGRRRFRLAEAAAPAGDGILLARGGADSRTHAVRGTARRRHRRYRPADPAGEEQRGTGAHRPHVHAFRGAVGARPWVGARHRAGGRGGGADGQRPDPQSGRAGDPGGGHPHYARVGEEWVAGFYFWKDLGATTP